jgi:hypothetical protein
MLPDIDQNNYENNEDLTGCGQKRLRIENREIFLGDIEMGSTGSLEKYHREQ